MEAYFQSRSCPADHDHIRRVDWHSVSTYRRCVGDFPETGWIDVRPGAESTIHGTDEDLVTLDHTGATAPGGLN
jgi:hypothetical protein